MKNIFNKPPALKFLLVMFLLVTILILSNTSDYTYSDEGTIYSIHLLSYKGIEEAKAKVKEFSDLGYNAFYKQETVDGKSYIYNVFIERFKSKPEAEKEAGILKELGLISNYDIRAINEQNKVIPKNSEADKSTKKPEVKDAKPEVKDIGPEIKDIEPDVKDNNQELKAYSLKVCSVREKAEAEELVKKLQDAGCQAFYRFETVKEKGEWYRVYAGGYDSKADAEEEAKTLIGSGLISNYEIKHTNIKTHPSETIQKTENKFYALHVSSYKESSNADADVRRLIGLGLKAFSAKTQVSGAEWFRVYVGEFQEEKEARKLGSELKGKGTISYFKPILIDKPTKQE
jgi:cell division septation protein DedD